MQIFKDLQRSYKDFHQGKPGFNAVLTARWPPRAVDWSGDLTARAINSRDLTRRTVKAEFSSSKTTLYVLPIKSTSFNTVFNLTTYITTTGNRQLHCDLRRLL